MDRGSHEAFGLNLTGEELTALVGDSAVVYFSLNAGLSAAEILHGLIRSAEYSALRTDTERVGYQLKIVLGPPGDKGTRVVIQCSNCARLELVKVASFRARIRRGAHKCESSVRGADLDHLVGKTVGTRTVMAFDGLRLGRRVYKLRCSCGYTSTGTPSQVESKGTECALCKGTGEPVVGRLYGDKRITTLEQPQKGKTRFGWVCKNGCGATGKANPGQLADQVRSGAKCKGCKSHSLFGVTLAVTETAELYGLNRDSLQNSVNRHQKRGNKEPMKAAVEEMLLHKQGGWNSWRYSKVEH